MILCEQGANREESWEGWLTGIVVDLPIEVCWKS